MPGGEYSCERYNNGMIIAVNKDKEVSFQTRIAGDRNKYNFLKISFSKTMTLEEALQAINTCREAFGEEPLFLGQGAPSN